MGAAICIVYMTLCSVLKSALWTIYVVKLCFTVKYAVRAQCGYKRTVMIGAPAQDSGVYSASLAADEIIAFGWLPLYTYLFGHVRSTALILQKDESNDLLTTIATITATYVSLHGPDV